MSDRSRTHEANASPAKLLALAKNTAGDLAVNAAEKGDHAQAREWSRLAILIDGLFREATELMSRV